MPTRYHGTETAAGVTPSSWSVGWNSTPAGNTWALSETIPASGGAARTVAGTGTSGQFVAAFRLVSPALTAQTISGTLSGVFQCLETNLTDNYTLAVAVKVITSAGADRGILLAVTASDDTSAAPPEMATTLTSRNLRDASENANIALSSLAISANDRIVLEVGFRTGSTSTANGSIQSFGNSVIGPLGYSEGDVRTNAAPWIAFSQTIDGTTDVGGITYFGSASTPADGAATTNTADPTAVTPPTGMLAGDLVFLIADSRVASLTQAISNAGGQTWTSHAQQSATTKSVRVFTCTFNGTWSANPSVSFGSTTCNSAYMHVFRPSTPGHTWAVNVAQTSTNDTTSPFSALTGHTTTGTRPTVTLQGWHSPDDNTWGTLTGTGWVNTGNEQYRNTSGSDQSAAFAHNISTTAQTLATPSKSQATLGPDNTQMWAITMQANPPGAIVFDHNRLAFQHILVR